MTEHYKRAAVVQFGYERSPDQDATSVPRHRVVVVGAGPVGLATAIDLAQRNVPVVLLDDADRIGEGSRGLCYSKRALEILDRLGAGAPVVDKGVSWKIGKVFFRDEQVYQFDLLPEAGHKMPAFVNLQQYYLEQYLVERCRAQEGLIDLRWKTKLVGIRNEDGHVALEAETPDGKYRLEADYVIACDGASSDTRRMMDMDFTGTFFADRFLIADVVMKADFPAERWFWFNPPFHRNQSVLLHMQADNVWRIDFQLGWDADPEEEKKPENVIPRLKAMLGEETQFELEWTSVYTFQCRRMKQFRHGRLFFVGDAAHQVSPFGARGANSGFQDSDNLLWKLKLVLDGKAPDSLLDSYNAERVPAADENLLNSTRSTDFITPKSKISHTFRDATLLLAEEYPFARTLVNSGRLSIPSVYRDSPLNTPDEAEFDSPMAPGTPSTDAPVNDDEWFLQLIGNNRFNGLYFSQSEGALSNDEQAMLNTLTETAPAPLTLFVAGLKPDSKRSANVNPLADSKGILKQRFDGQPGTFYLFRPDQHVTARWRQLEPKKIEAALNRAIGRR